MTDEDRSAIGIEVALGQRERLQWKQDLLRPWLDYRVQIPVGPLVCVIDGRTRAGR